MFILNTFYKVINYLKDGFYSTDNYEKTLKKYLIYTFSTISLIIFFIMGINALQTNSLLGMILLGGALLFVFNIVYLKFMNDNKLSAHIVVYFLFILMLYLAYTGGINHTGALWSLVLPPIILFIHGLKRGLIELSVFLFIFLGILFIEDGFMHEALYAYDFKVRIVMIFMIIAFLSSLYQYTREISTERMRQMQKDLESFLRIDPLTGLYNRRGYDDIIKNNQKTSFGSILMCDIDYFKKINDTYGHDAGDYVLKKTASMLKESIRSKDIIIRWGGEEFIIFLHEVGVHEAYSIAEKLRMKIESNPIIYYDKLIYVTLSIGISPIEKDFTISEAIKEADNLMYLSKTNGRNRTTKVSESSYF